MRIVTFFFLLILSCSHCFSQSAEELYWNDLEIVDYNKVETDFFGIKDSTNWPIFNDSLYLLDGKTIKIEGYYYCMQSTNLETLTTEKVCILAVSKEPTIQICGVPQYRQNEFIHIKDNPVFFQGKKVKLKGTLHLNRNGANESLISMDKVNRIK